MVWQIALPPADRRRRRVGTFLRAMLVNVTFAHGPVPARTDEGGVPVDNGATGEVPILVAEAIPSLRAIECDERCVPVLSIEPKRKESLGGDDAPTVFLDLSLPLFLVLFSGRRSSRIIVFFLLFLPRPLQSCDGGACRIERSNMMEFRLPLAIRFQGQ